MLPGLVATILSTMAGSSPPRRAARSRLERRTRTLTIVAGILAVLAVAAASLTTLALANPERARALLASQPTPTLFLLNLPESTSTTDPRGTLPPSWTPSSTPLPPPTLTPSNTPTRTPTPTRTTTPVPTLTFTPPATVADGWYEIAVQEARLAFQLTSTWSALTLLGRDPGAALAEVGQRDPALAQSLRDGLGQAVLENLILVAFDTATATDFYIVNLTMAYASPASGSTIDAVRDLHLQIYESSDFYEVLATDSTRVDFQPAYRIRYTSPFESEAGATTVYHLEVISEQRRSQEPLLLITLSTSQERRNIYEALLDRIVSTIRFTR